MAMGNHPHLPYRRLTRNISRNVKRFGEVEEMKSLFSALRGRSNRFRAGVHVAMLTVLTLSIAVSTAVQSKGQVKAQSKSAKQTAEATRRAQKAAQVFIRIMNVPDQSIPQSLLDKAEAVAVFPGVIKAGFIVGGRSGQGVISRRVPGGWSAPAFFKLGGAS